MAAERLTQEEEESRVLSSQELAMDALPKRRSAVRAEDALRTGKSLAYKPSYPKRPSSGRKRRSAPESIESASSPSKRVRRPPKVSVDNKSATSEEEEEEVEEEVFVEEESEEEDEEESSQRRRRKGRQGKPKKGKGKESQEEEEEVMDQETEERNITLKEVMQKGRLDSVVREWCSIYKARPSQGAVILVNMVIAASGCPERISTAQFESGDVKEALDELVTSSWTKAGDGNEGNNNNSSSREKAVVAFVGRVIGASKESFLYDGYLLNVLTSWVGAVSNSSARVLREAATRTACEMVRALIVVVKGLADLLAKNRAQAARERAKATPAARRLQTLDETAAELEEHTRVLQAAVEEIHRAVFAARYRDVVAAIRCEVCRALADDICAWPEVMLRDTYIKYVAWLLNDAAADVRLAAIEGVRQIYTRCATPESCALLETFTERFKPRLAEMALDVSTPVAVVAIDVCRILATAMHALDEDDLRHLYTLVSEADPARRRAAGAFAQAVVFASMDREADDAAGSSQGTGAAAAALAETRVRGVLELVLNYSLLPAMPCYVVDALWAVSPALTDWRTMCAMLLRDAADTDDGTLSHDEQACLAGVLGCCCRMVAGIPVTPDSSSSSSSSNNNNNNNNNNGSGSGAPVALSAVQQEECQEMTAELARTLPKLLVKYRADSEIVAELAGVVPALSLPAPAFETSVCAAACVSLGESAAPKSGVRAR